jgi:hypothetical protein
MVDLFAVVNDVTHKKSGLITTENEADYNSFMMNRALSYYKDCVIFANEMNMNPELPNKLQHDYLINIVRSRRRFSKWAKKDKSDDVAAIQRYFGYNKQRAREALAILSKQQLTKIKESIEDIDK